MWIRIKSIKLFGYHGVYEVEKKTGGTFEFDVDVHLFDMAGRTDELAETLDYTAIVDRVTKISDSRSYNLIETLATDICSSVINLSPLIEEVVVRVRKFTLPLEAELAYVEAERRISR
ncbi:MAG TPA: dihydroneopterin aldolase [Candidatus Kapabacteria bacterium]